jgi:hypothetical protein
MQCSESFKKESVLPATGLRILWRKSARAQQGESIKLLIGLSGMSGLCVFGSP